jgi:hypothetical protein
MALIKWSALVADVRGKLNGTVFSRNRYAAYVRTKVTPSNPQSTRQQEVRSKFAHLSSYWRVLTQQQRDAWNNAVINFLRTNIFGDTYKPTGLNLFVRLNMNLFNIACPMITMPPKPEVVDKITIQSIEIFANVNKLNLIIQASAPMNHYPVISLTRPLSPGVQFVKSEFRMSKFIYHLNPALPNQYTIELGNEFATKYGNMINYIGRAIFIKIQPINKVSGLSGVPLQEKIIIQ